MEPYIIIISLASIIIISHFINIYSDNTGVPSVLLLIVFGMILQLDQVVGTKFGVDNFQIISDSTQKSLLSVLGIGGLILILLEAALDLEINKKMFVESFKALISALFGLFITTFAIAYILTYWIDELDFLHSLLYAIPLSILSSAIIIPSIQQGFSQSKKSFLIYESTFSDVLGLLVFQVLIESFESFQVGGSINGQEIIINLLVSIFFSVIISILLIYLFQKIKGHVKLFLLFSILILIYSIGKILHLSPLLAILIFGIILNNYKTFFIGRLSKVINHDVVNHIQEDFKVIIAESAFVVRTFFFIVFGYYVSLSSVLNTKVIIISLAVLFVTYFIRSSILVPLFKGKIWPETFIAPRGLITILLFFSIPAQFVSGLSVHIDIIPGVLLFIILGTSLIMSNALINVKKFELKRKLNQNKLHDINNENNKLDDNQNPNQLASENDADEANKVESESDTDDTNKVESNNDTDDTNKVESNSDTDDINKVESGEDEDQTIQTN